MIRYRKDRKALLFLCLKGINVIVLFLYFFIAGWTSDISRAVYLRWKDYDFAGEYH